MTRHRRDPQWPWGLITLVGVLLILAAGIAYAVLTTPWP